MYQFVIGRSQKRMAGKAAKSGVVDQRLRMFDPHPDREWLWLHEYATLVEHMERIARAMTDRQHDMIGGDDFAAFQFHRADSACAVLAGRDVDAGDFRTEPVFATKRLDLGADSFDDRDQPERADVRLVVPQDFLRARPPRQTR